MEIDQLQIVRIIFCPDGSVKFPWWTPETQKLMAAMGLVSNDRSSKFCG